MTAPTGPDRTGAALIADELSNQIATAICPGIYCESHEECRQDATAAMPAVLTYADQRAADELDYQADGLTRIAGGHPIVEEVIGLLRARAEALRSAVTLP